MATKQTKPTSSRPKKKRPTKTETMLKLLRRENGASMAQLQKATGWQPHSVRAALSGLRKQGIEIVRSKDQAGTTRYAVKGQA